MENFGLYQLNKYISRVITLNFSESVFVAAEILNVKKVREHFYLELIEKGVGDAIVAQASAVIWKTNVTLIESRLQSSLDAFLKPGIEVKFIVRPEFHPQYGLKLIASELDENYTLGKIQSKKERIVKELKDLNLWKTNQGIRIPLILQRIAIISSPTSAGYFDFMDQINSNPDSYKFHSTLFPCSMQGDKVEKEVSQTIIEINQQANRFECIVIIRGGGSKFELHDFDNLAICKEVGKSKLPVFTGIGHHEDESILDLVASVAFKTPTAVAEFLVGKFKSFEDSIGYAYRNIKESGSAIVQNNLIALNKFWNHSNQLNTKKIYEYTKNLGRLNYLIRHTAEVLINHHEKAILESEYQIDQSDPMNILNKGYVMVYQGQVRVKSSTQFRTNLDLRIIFSDGEVNVSNNEK